MGLKIRHNFDERQKDLFSRYVTRGEEYTLIICDINGLHDLNREEGFSAGDNLIKQVGADLVNLFGFENTFIIGGDEFAVIIQGINLVYTEINNTASGVVNVTVKAKYKTYKQVFQYADQKVIDKKLSLGLGRRNKDARC